MTRGCGCSDAEALIVSTPSVQVAGHGTPNSPYQLTVNPGGNVVSVNDLVPDGSGNIELDLTLGQFVEPEDFPGATDNQQFSAAIASIAATGGVVRLRPGKNYVWTTAPTTFDFSVYKKPIVIWAFGATITANYAGGAWTLQGNTGNTVANGLVWFGGEVDNSIGDGITLNDSGKAFFFRASAGCPNGSGWVAANVTGFSENHHFIECYDNNSKHAISFLNLGSIHLSFARTVIRSLRTQGGVNGEAKINIGDNTALYGALIDGVSGNLVSGAVVLRVAGNMHGAIIQGNFHVEVSANPVVTTATWTNTSSTIACPAVTASELGYAVSGTGIAGYVGTVTPGVGFVLSSSPTSTIPVNPSGSGTGASITLTPGVAYYFTVGTLSGGQVASMIAPLNVNATMGLMHPGSSQPSLYQAVNQGWGVNGIGVVARYKVANASPVALAANTETTVFTIGDLQPGEYELDVQMSCSTTAATTAANFQCRISGGTATYTTDGPSSAQTDQPSATVNNASPMLYLSAYLVVTVVGTVIVTVRASAAGQINGTTPSSGYSGCSGYRIRQVA